MSTCKTCPFFDAQPATQTPKAINGSAPMGACRAKPPVTMIVGVQNNVAGPTPAFAAIWPTVTADEFCGEHPERKQRQVLDAMAEARKLWDSPLRYEPNSGEMNRTPTPQEMIDMANGMGPITVAVPRGKPTKGEPAA